MENKEKYDFEETQRYGKMFAGLQGARFSALAVERMQHVQMYFAFFTSGFIFSIRTSSSDIYRGVFHVPDETELFTKLGP